MIEVYRISLNYDFFHGTCVILYVKKIILLLYHAIFTKSTHTLNIIKFIKYCICHDSSKTDFLLRNEDRRLVGLVDLFKYIQLGLVFSFRVSFDFHVQRIHVMENNDDINRLLKTGLLEKIWKCT